MFQILDILTKDFQLKLFHSKVVSCLIFLNMSHTLRISFFNLAKSHGPFYKQKTHARPPPVIKADM